MNYSELQKVNSTSGPKNYAEINRTHRELYFLPSLGSQLAKLVTGELGEICEIWGKSEKSRIFAISRIQGTCSFNHLAFVIGKTPHAFGAARCDYSAGEGPKARGVFPSHPRE